MAQTRQLAAILFADIVGFTALMEEDEQKAMLIREKFKKKLSAEVSLHGGRMIKFSGDGALCSFDSAAESVRAAMSVQSDMQEDPKIPLRIGVHQADVVFEESDVHGDGVNIASRLESFAIPGSRSITNGFRCYRELPGDTAVSLTKPIVMAYRDYSREQPVDDKTFEIFLHQYRYDKTPLNAKTDSIVQSESWTAEKISFDAAYNNERMVIWLFLPRNLKKPFQTILFFPGSGDIYARNFDPVKNITLIDFIMKSGRALVYPMYKGTWERHDEGLKSDLQEETNAYKDHVIMWNKDFGRTVDYLETRSDIMSDRLGYLGWSWGGFMGGIIPAVEKRIKAIVLNVGGMEMERAQPEADQINFLPRVTQPILMLNGKHDMFFPIESSEKPMFGFIGTNPADKKRIIYESGHLVPRADFIREALNWYDKYLGPVK